MSATTDASYMIIAVDDEEASRNMLVEALAPFKLQVATFDGANAALEFLNARVQAIGEPYVKFIISDWVMPNGDGLQFVANVRKLQTCASIPFVLISGAVTREELLTVASHGVDGVLLKPFNNATLVAEAERAVQRRLDKDLAKLMRR